ncbi:hypothetical protein F4780DRAFT_772859 [Xylariomycetidae sp. FL0641]|nr:hypothetical protein F4780DRAFT_772859 [Xylariomycetidae sp. FL0641]
MSNLPSLVAFGSVASWPEPEQLQQLRQALRRNSLFHPVLASLRELGSAWRALVAHDPALSAVDGQASSEKLAELASDSDDIPVMKEKSNMMTLPITVVTQVVQYLSYLDHAGPTIDHASVLKSTAAGGGIQGFCAGLLSALAIAATSVTLAFCVGAYVDKDQLMGGSGSQTSNLADLQRLLLNHPETYVAVKEDARDAVITTPTESVRLVQQDLTTRPGFSVKETGLGGRYHTRVHADVPAKILTACRDLLHDRFGSQPSLVRSNTDARPIVACENAARVALDSILTFVSDWYLTISSSASALDRTEGSPLILAIGANAIPASVSRRFPVVKVREILTESSRDDLNGISAPRPAPSRPLDDVYPEDAIAVVGMACKFPGADSVDAFWDLLTQGKSMLGKMPKARFDTVGLPRTPKDLQFWGNFVSDIDCFDHKFFKKSAREAASMDPQQRLLLEVTYQALESSGYFADPTGTKPRDIGCYLGACSTDYDANVASHPATAYSTTGMLRAFLSGRLSHYFGWSGPSLTFDTACSSSAVAIHSACKALQQGECSQAVAGGVTLLTGPYLYENLSAAHFLSPTGATKPFDAAADGYCRGEGVGIVVLKKLSDALAGDNVLGVIAASGVNQNANCVSITVPHSGSQSDLYRRAVAHAGINPHEVAFVEAHGTGTPVGDPIEMESIRQVFGGPQRSSSSPMFASSAKGNIGHLEGASGVAGLIKSLLQIQHRTACVQASFSKLNPKIPQLEADRLCIPTSNRALPKGPTITACVNNYGAAGSNATMILIEAPRRQKPRGLPGGQDATPALARFPIQIAAGSVTSLLEYCRALDVFCEESSASLTGDHTTLASIAYNLSRQQNQELGYVLTTTTACDVDQFRGFLREQLGNPDGIVKKPQELPVILCFGGQVGQSAGLSLRLWQHSSLFRYHLDTCDETLRSLGYPSIYPSIFQTVSDVVILQSAVFSVQYACASAYIDSGLKVAGLVGHSLGQMAALCVSGILSLRDALKLVAGRASLMKSHWGPEPGTMIAVESDRKTIEGLTASIAATDQRLIEIACFNGPSSLVTVSDKLSADRLEDELVKHSIRHKRLHVTNGFHSRFTDPMIPHLVELASSLTFHKPRIPLETCTDGASWEEPTAQLIAAHTRDPVFFGQAIQRIQDRFGPCTFLEAGSDSSVVSMARRALNPAPSALNNFIPMDLGKPASLEKLADTTVELWKRGHRFQFWNFHRLQALEYDVLRLPSYCFEKTKHWLKLETAAPAPTNTIQNQAVPSNTAITQPAPPVLIRGKSNHPDQWTCEVDPRSEEYQALVKGRVVLGKEEGSLALYVELISRALSIAGEGSADRVLSIEDLQVKSPLGIASDRTIYLHLRRVEKQLWAVQVTSQPLLGTGQTGSAASSHAVGTVRLRSSALPAVESDFQRYERIASRDRMSAVHQAPDAASVKGGVIYKVFFDLVHTAAKGDQVVGEVSAKARVPSCLKEAATQPWVLESFLQIADLHANFMRDAHTDDEAWVSDGVEHIQFGPAFGSSEGADAPSWDVLGFVSRSAAGGPSYDLFIYHAVTGRLALYLLGVRYVKVRRTPWPPTFSPGDVGVVEVRQHGDPEPVHPPVQARTKQQEINDPQLDSGVVEAVAALIPSEPQKDTRTMIFEDISSILQTIADVARDDIKGKVTLEDLGVDSLMMIEVIAEISSLYRTELPIEDLEQLTDVDSLVRYLDGRGCRGESTQATEESPSSTSTTPASISADTSALPTPSITRPPSRGADKKPRDLASSSSSSSSSNKATGSPAAAPADAPSTSPDPDAGLGTAAQEIFDGLRLDFDRHSAATGFAGFWARVYPAQAGLVDRYIVEAFAALGCDLGALRAGDRLPAVAAALPRHARLVAELHGILGASGNNHRDGGAFVRTAKALDATPAAELYARLLRAHPQHAAETRLLNVTGSRLAACLAGRADALHLLLADRAHRGLMADVYAEAPMCRATTRLLADFLVRAFTAADDTTTPGPPGRVFRLLEVGGGTGGTARYLVERLAAVRGLRFEYWFTDVSAGLVAQARRTFAAAPAMRFATYDCEAAPPAGLAGTFDVVVATNVVHAVGDAGAAAANLARFLRPRGGGVLCLVEFTRRLYWFDLVYGLLGGWWAFRDGRAHALADQWFWDARLRGAGFGHVSWTDGASEEAKTMRVIAAFKAPAAREAFRPLGKNVFKRAGIPTETFTWKRVDDLELRADVYYPKVADGPGKKRPVALMIHGGGHLLFSRQDIPMKHVRTLLQRGFLPVSVDYRLCPEMTLFEGPVTDCCDALRWVRQTLPSLTLSGPRVEVDSSRVIALGWSSGGQLAMTLGYTPLTKGFQPPDVILPFYSPSNLEDDFWKKPLYVKAAEEEPQEIWGELDCVRSKPIVEYTPLSNKKGISLSLTLQDDRARLILHMNWAAQSLPVLIGGLPHKSQFPSTTNTTDWKSLPMPPLDKIRECSPYHHIVAGGYRTPTFMVHGNADDWLPHTMTERTVAALRERGVRCGLRIAEQCGHAFDLWPVEDKLGVGWAAIEAAYDFACEELKMGRLDG